MTAVSRTRHQFRWDDNNKLNIRKSPVFAACEPNLHIAFTVPCIYQPTISSSTLPLQGVPEDLLFFYQSIRQGGGVFRVDPCLLVYRYHEKAATHSVSESVPLLRSFTTSTSFCSGRVDPLLSAAAFLVSHDHVLTGQSWPARITGSSNVVNVETICWLSLRCTCTKI